MSAHRHHDHTTESPKTVSTCTPRTARGTHVFDVIGYSQHRGIGTQEFIRSGDFSVGGHRWAILLYPDGYGIVEDDMEDYVSAYLLLLGGKGGGAKVRASCDLRLVDRATGLSSPVFPDELRRTTRVLTDDARCFSCMMKLRKELEAPPYLVDDRLTMECVVTVKKEPRVSRTRPFPRIKVPPSDIKSQLGNLLEAKEGSDVAFTVAGETFAAHKLVLAMRSPVFKAEFYGPMKESASTEPITIRDMQPDVFRALLRFIYTDSLPDRERDDDDDDTEMIQHLFVAADRYAVDRLKLICLSILCKNLHVRNLAATMALAEHHHCRMLTEACIEFTSCSNIW